MYKMKIRHAMLDKNLVDDNVTTKIFYNQTSWKIFAKSPFFYCNSELGFKTLYKQYIPCHGQLTSHYKRHYFTSKRE